MLLLLKIVLFASAAIFVMCMMATTVLVGRAVAKGLPSLRREDVASYRAVVREIPEDVRTLLLLRKIQSIAWMVSLGCVLAIVVWFA